MSIDWDKLKGATLDDKALDALKASFDEVTAQRDTARRESIDGRKGKDARIKELTDAQEKLFERLGISALDDLDTLPDAKGQAEALKQYESKIKRLERERDDAAKAKGEIEGKFALERKERVIAQSIAKHPFIDADDVRALVSLRVKQEGDDFFYDGGDGKSIAIDDAVAAMAKTKPHLVRPAGSGAGGSGFKPGQKPGAQTMTRTAFESLPPAAKVEASRQGVTLSD